MSYSLVREQILGRATIEGKPFLSSPKKNFYQNDIFLQHPFICEVKKDDDSLLSLCVADFKRKTSSAGKQSMATETLLKDPETGETMSEWLEGVLQLKEKYSPQLISLLHNKAKVDELEKTTNSGELKESLIQQQIIKDKSLQKEIDTKKLVTDFIW